MLVLSRKCGEGIVIEGEIHLTVLSVSGRKIRIGVTAPRHVRVRRSELDRASPVSMSSKTNHALGAQELAAELLHMASG